MTAAVSTLTYGEAQRIVREALRDKTYQLTPLGMEAAAYLRVKRKRLTAGSYRKYESALDKLARFFPDLELGDLERPVGIQRLEEFMDHAWGDLEPATYNSNLSVVKDFFGWASDRGLMHTDPARPIERAKVRDPNRETFTRGEVDAMYAAAGDDTRDRLCLQLLLRYALRKNELRNVQFKHFDHLRHRLTVYGKGGTVEPIPVPGADPFWHELERLILETGAHGAHYLIPGRRGNRHGSRLLPDRQISQHALHNWFYARQVDAGILPVGTTEGSGLHKARHTALQQLYDETKDIKLVQRLARHKSALVTADVYVRRNIDDLDLAMAQMIEGMVE